MKDFLFSVSNDINNMKDLVARNWVELTNKGTNSIDELFDILKGIECNLPCSYYYIVDRMLVDREHNSTLMCSHYIEDLMMFENVDKPSDLPEDFESEVWEILKSGYGSCNIDW